MLFNKVRLKFIVLKNLTASELLYPNVKHQEKLKRNFRTFLQTKIIDERKLISDHLFSPRCVKDVRDYHFLENRVRNLGNFQLSDDCYEVEPFCLENLPNCVVLIIDLIK